MFDAVLRSDWDMVLFAVPFVGIFLISLFRLDELVASPKKKAKPRRTAFRLDRNGEPMLCDPDGRTWSRVGRSK